MNERLKILQSVRNQINNSIIVDQKPISPQQRLKKQNLQKHQIYEHQQEVGFFKKLWRFIPNNTIQFIQRCANEQVQNAYKCIPKLKIKLALDQNQQKVYVALVQSINGRINQIKQLRHQVQLMKTQCQKAKQCIELTIKQFNTTVNEQQHAFKMFQSFIENLSVSHYDVAEIYIQNIGQQSQKYCKQLLSKIYAFDHVQKMMQGSDFYLQPQSKFMDQQGSQLVQQVKQLSYPQKQIIKQLENNIMAMKDIQWNKPQKQFRNKIQSLSKSLKEQLTKIRNKIIGLECDKSTFLMFCNVFSKHKQQHKKIQFEQFNCSELTKEALKYLQPILNYYYKHYNDDEQPSILHYSNKKQLPKVPSLNTKFIDFFVCSKCLNINDNLLQLTKTLYQQQILGQKQLQQFDNFQKIQHALKSLIIFYKKVIQIVKPNQDYKSDQGIQKRTNEIIQTLNTKIKYMVEKDKYLQEKQKVIQKINNEINGIMKQKRVNEFLKENKIDCYPKEYEIEQIKNRQNLYLNVINDLTIKTLRQYFQKAINSLLHCLTEYCKLNNELNRVNNQLKGINQNDKQKQNYNKLVLEYKQLKQQNNKLVQQYLQLKQNSKKLVQQNQQIQQKNKEFLLEYKQIKQQNNKLVQQYKQLKQKNIRLVQLQKQLKQENNKLAQKNKQVQQKNNKLKQQYLQCKQKNNKLLQQNEQLQQKTKEYKQVKQQNNKLVQQYKQLKQKNNKLVQQQKQLKQENNKLVQQNKQLQQKTKEFFLEYKQVKQQNNKLVQQNQQLRKENNKLVQQNKQVQQKSKEFVLEYKQVKQQNNKLVLEHKKIQQIVTNQIIFLKLESNDSLAIIEYLNTIISYYSEQKQRNDKIQQTIKQKSNNIDKFFVGDILDNQQQSKKYLITQIQLLMNSTIKKTTLLYRMDKLNKVNFHQYLDKKRNFIVIIRTKNNKLLGGFSEGALIQNQFSKQRACIFSLTNQKVFKINTKNPSYKSINYDSFYVIFGNSQLRLKALDDKVFSNFNIVNGYYQTQGENVDILFGQGKECRQVKVDTYQFYQIEFIN